MYKATVVDLSHQYPKNDQHMNRYIEYQKQYFDQPRQSDQKILDILKDLFLGGSFSALDIGCSNGALLYHLKNTFPKATLFGEDLSEPAIRSCRNTPALSEVQFEVKDVLDDVPNDRVFDVIILNAILFALPDEHTETAFRHVYSRLCEGGYLVVFDLMTHYEKNLTIIEKSREFPEGLPLHFRSYEFIRDIGAKSGFSHFNFYPFFINKPLEDKGNHSINTHTVETKNGLFLSFRGCLSQPWCHFVAKK